MCQTDVHFKDDDLDIIYSQLLEDYGAVTYEAFINLLVRVILVFSSKLIRSPT